MKRPSTQIEQLKQYFSDPIIIRQFFSNDEITKLYELKKTCTEKQVKTNGTHICYNDNWREQEQAFLQDKIQALIGEFKVHGGNYFETTVPFYPHVDNGKTDIIPYKNILIPMMTSHNTQGLVLFKQRWPHYSSTFYKKGFGTKMSYNQLIVDYNDIIGIDANSTVDIPDVQHINKEDLQGLSVDQVIYYKPGDLIIFDTAQIHAGSYFPANYTKHGYAIFTHRDVI